MGLTVEPVERIKLQLLDGGLSLATPGDKVPPSGALQMENFRPDTQGRLRSRSSTAALTQVVDGTTPFVHSIAMRGANNYFGAGANLYTGIYPVAPIATGFDGFPLGMAAMNGYTFVMNRNKQIKYDTSSHAWGITPPASACSAAVGSTGLPNGVYEYFVTFGDLALANESNPSPVSAPVTLASQQASLTGIPVSSNPDVGLRNIYRAGGTQGGTYLIGTIYDNTSTVSAGHMVNVGTLAVGNDNVSDAAAVLNGVLMRTNLDLPPAAWGLAGPYFGYLLAFSSAAHVNRLWWSLPNQPQYWPGAALGAGNWTDVGNDGEAIVAITIHAEVAIIYKQFSIWRLVGTPDLGYLERITDKVGIVGFHGAVSAGQYDYFATKEGVYKFDFDHVSKVSPQVDPIFRGTYVEILSTTIQIAPFNPTYTGQIALGYGEGRLYVSYPEATTTGTFVGHNSQTLVYYEDKQAWATLRLNTSGPHPTGFDVFYYYPGQAMLGGSYDAVLDIYQNEASTGQSDTGAPLQLAYQSRYEDAGQPDNQKTFVELVIDYEFAGDTANVFLFYDNGVSSAAQSSFALGSLTGTGRQKARFNPSALHFDGLIATNVSVRIEVPVCNFPVIIHAIYIYCYPEASSFLNFSTRAMDFGTGQVKQCKEIQIDVDNEGGSVQANVYTDLPGNELTLRQTPSVPSGTARRPYFLPIPLTEGRIWRVALQCGSLFQLYAIRMLMRVVGTYVEAYESAAGFVWDSFPGTFETAQTHIPRGYSIALHADPIKRGREIELRIDCLGTVLVTRLSDLPGDTMASRYTKTSGPTVGEQVIRLPLPAGINPEIEGRMWQLQLSSATARFILYEAGMESLAVGVYVEAYEAGAGAVYDSREVDFGSEKPKEARELELDCQTTGAITATLYSDLPSGVMAQVAQKTFSTTGRQKVPIALTPTAGLLAQYPAGRMFQVILTGSNAFRLYGAKLKVREFGGFLTLDEASAGAVWDSTPTDLGVPRDKVFDQVRFEIDTDGSAQLNVYTDLPGEAMTLRATQTITTVGSGRRFVTVPLPPNIQGRLIQCVLFNATSGFRLYQAQVFARSIGRYIANTVGDAFRSLEWDAGSERVKMIKKIEVDVQADGPLTLTLLTDQGGAMNPEYSVTIAAKTTRAPYRLQLPPGIRGRLLQIQITGTNSGRVYKLRAWVRPLNEPEGKWAWQEYPLEESDALQQWFPLAAAQPTNAEWAWAPFPVTPTEAQWQWIKFLSVGDTPEAFEWIDVPIDITG